MNLIFYLFSLSFSFFFILLSYWKEDKTLNLLGSISLMIISIILVGTSVQSTENVLNYAQYISNATGNFTIYNYVPKTYTEGVFFENLGIGTMLVIFTAIQYLYFSIAYKFAESKEEH